MGKIAIEFQNISKQYALGSIGAGTLSRDLNRWWARIRGKVSVVRAVVHSTRGSRREVRAAGSLASSFVASTSSFNNPISSTE